jgi:hypothetical protein
MVEGVLRAAQQILLQCNDNVLQNMISDGLYWRRLWDLIGVDFEPFELSPESRAMDTQFAGRS